MASDAAIQEAAGALARGELVAFPTETVYGLGADATAPAAVAKVFEAKGRPRFDPLIVHLADSAAAERYACTDDPRFWTLAEAFWPGPLTLILPKRAVIPELVTAGQPTVALRWPRHPVAQALLEAFGGAVAAPSANRFGRVSPTRAAHVRAQLGDALRVLDGGRCAVGLESTIVSLATPVPTLLRPGAVTEEALRGYLGDLVVPPEDALRDLAPGRQTRHYAPQTPLYFADDPRVLGLTGRLGWLRFGARAAGFEAAVEVQLSAGEDLVEAAAGLFAGLRELDGAGVDGIVVDRVPAVGIGRAILDRLGRGVALGAATAPRGPRPTGTPRLGRGSAGGPRPPGSEAGAAAGTGC